jgi:protein ImuB
MSTPALWIACLPTGHSPAPEPAGPWLAHYGPQPAAHDDGWVLDVSASIRLFGGRVALLQRLRREGLTHGWGRLGAAPTALAALACAHRTPANGGLHAALGPDWTARIDALPIAHLSATRPHGAVLDALGLRTLGALRGCPRHELAQRTSPALLQALDALYGTAALAVRPWQPPPRFRQTLALPAPSSDGSALAFAAQRLLVQMARWLHRRQAGVLQWRLGWVGQPTDAALHFRHRRPLRDPAQLRPLLHEALARTALSAPVDALWLETIDIAPYHAEAASLLPGRPADDALTWSAVLERLAARLGPERVQAAQLAAHWDPLQRQTWHPALAHEPRTAATGCVRARSETRSAAVPTAPADTLWEPAWRLPHPRRLALDARGRPLLQGQPLRRLLGPQRIVTGWWNMPIARDIYVAATPDGRCWWLYRVHDGAAEGPHWFLAGVYA